MPKTYVKANDVILEQLNTVMLKYHQPLIDAELRVDVLMAFASRNDDGEITGPAISHHGYPAKAVIKKTSTKERANGFGDVLLTLDGDNWNDWPETEQNAILDHELTHVELVLEDDEQSASAKVARDDLGRPKIKMRIHDFDSGGFYEIAERHKDASAEVQFIKSVGTQAVKQGLIAGF